MQRVKLTDILKTTIISFSGIVPPGLLQVPVLVVCYTSFPAPAKVLQYPQLLALFFKTILWAFIPIEISESLALIEWGVSS